MEDVRQLMEIIDDHVKSFPEGDYLKMCNNLRNIFRFMKGPPPEEESDFESESEVEVDLTFEYEGDEGDDEWIPGQPVYTTELFNTGPPVPVPFQPILPARVQVERPEAQLRPAPFTTRDFSSWPVDREMMRTQIHREYTEVDDRLRYANRLFKNLKIRRNITAWVRFEAVREFCQSRMLHVPEYTLQAVAERYTQYTFPDERSFYEEYLTRFNDNVREQMYTISREIDILTARREACIDRYHEYQ